MRHLALLALGLALLSAGCGGDGDAPVVRLLVDTFDVDGETPSGLGLIEILPDGEEGRAFDLVPAPDGVPDEYVAPGAPRGTYRLRTPDGWRSLLGGTTPVELTPGEIGRPIRLGQGRSIYVTAAGAQLLPSETWGAERIGSDGTHTPVAVTVLSEPSVHTVVIRIPPADWKDELQVVGILTPRWTLAEGDPGPLSEPFRFRVPEENVPIFTRARGASRASLDILLGGRGEDAEHEVVVSVPDFPISVVHRTRTSEGLARFAGVPAMDRDLHITVEGQPGVWRLKAEGLRLLPVLHLALSGGGSDEVELHAEGPIDGVAVRLPGSTTYGRVPWQPTAEANRVRLPRVDGMLRVRSGRGFAWVGPLDGVEAGATIDVGAFEAGVTMRGVVEGGGLDHMVRLLRREADDALVGGDAFTLRVSRYGAFEAIVPVGEYELDVVGPGATERRRRPVRATTPGGQIHLSLDAPGR